MTDRLLSFGHGYSARALTAWLFPRGWQVTGTTRSAQKAEALRKTGVTAVIWPGSDIRQALAQTSHVLISAGPGQDGDPVLAELRDEIAAAAPHLTWVGYLSTTGVYGDHQGGWVDENTPLSPSTERGQARVAAEAAWQAIQISHYISSGSQAFMAPGEDHSPKCATGLRVGSSKRVRCFRAFMSTTSRRF